MSKYKLFQELLAFEKDISHVTLSSKGDILDSTIPTGDVVYEKLLPPVFFTAKKLNHQSTNDCPIILSSPNMLTWAFVFDFKDKDRIYLLGPVKIENNSSQMTSDENNIQATVQKTDCEQQIDASTLPVFEFIKIIQHTLQLHYVINDEKAYESDILYHSTELNLESYEVYENYRKEHNLIDRRRTWVAERELLKMIKEGNLNYKKALSDASKISKGIKTHSIDTISNAKLSVIVFTNMCMRAAIEGGVSPDEAYKHGDSYVDKLFKCVDVTSITNISHEMYESFINKVHSLKKYAKYSHHIVNCLEYIDNHLTEDISIDLLSKRVGYSKYYLLRKFKEEVGTSINDYLNSKKIEKAKSLLISTTMPIQEISDQLGYCSRSYFSNQFKKIVNQSPAEYRKAELIS